MIANILINSHALPILKFFDITPSEEEMVKAEVPVTSGNVQFRWLQNNHRGGCFDCWEIDNVTITVPSEFSNPQPITFIDYR